MRIAYIIEVNPYSNSGIVKKINDQVSFWTKEGHEVQSYIIWPNNNEEIKYLLGEEFSNKIINQIPESFIKTYLTKIFGIKKVSNKLQVFKPDVVYIRQNIWYPGLVQVLNKYNVILELNSVDFLEMNFYSKLKKWVYLYGKEKILNITSGLIAVTPDILKYYKSYGIPNRVVSNGINLERFYRPTSRELGCSPVNLIFVGSKNMEWHGLDKVFALAKLYPQHKFHIVGYNKEDFISLELKNIVFHGWLDKESLEELYLNCNFGIGSFGNHLVGKEIDSTLKVREYLAYGLPVILGHYDVDFTNEDFVFKATDENFKLKNEEEITDFIEKYKDYIVPKDNLKKISSKEKEKQRLSFFEKTKKK